MSSSRAWSRALTMTRAAEADGLNLPCMIRELAKTYGDQPALLSPGSIRSYHALSLRMNRCAHWAKSQRLTKGDCVGLLMENSSDFVIIWLALTRIGCTVALLNTNLRGDSLLHCIRVADCKVVIVSDTTTFDEPSVITWNWDALRDSLTGFSSAPVDDPAPAPDDRALLIYTSGTTGLPKATIITHRRIIEWSFWFAGMMDAQSSDRLYNCLPMYHSIGGVVAIGSMLVSGGSVLIRKRFSTSRFWIDVEGHNCTIFQYIGELCRYLTLAEPHPFETKHRLRLACGNGLQQDVWQQFQERFAIPRILEYYAATEGHLSLYNVEGKPGAIGRVPGFLTRYFSISIIHCDPETGEVLRDENGFCIPCATDEIGEAISRIGNRQFDGYTDAKSSGRKVLSHVFAEGDSWFRSGDLMRKDSDGYFYFVDRIGDTFRWKGENVSTTEVTSVVRGTAGVKDAVVYGVTVPGNEGRAGMAAICVDDHFDFAQLATHLSASLPDYAHPMYVRVCKSLDMTGTFKLTKTNLAREGVTGCADPVWIRDATGQYVSRV